MAVYEKHPIFVKENYSDLEHQRYLKLWEKYQQTQNCPTCDHDEVSIGRYTKNVYTGSKMNKLAYLYARGRDFYWRYKCSNCSAIWFRARSKDQEIQQSKNSIKKKYPLSAR